MIQFLDKRENWTSYCTKKSSCGQVEQSDSLLPVSRLQKPDRVSFVQTTKYKLKRENAAEITLDFIINKLIQILNRLIQLEQQES